MNRDYLDVNCIRKDSIIFYRYLLKLGMNNKFIKEDKESPKWHYKDGQDKYYKKAKLFFERKDGLIKEIYYEF